MPDKPARAEPEYALIVQQQGKPQQVLVHYLTLLLNYRYGLDIIVVDKFVEAFSTIQKYRKGIRCAFLIQNRSIDSRASISSLNLEGTIPLFLLLPKALIADHKILCRRLENVQFCSWESAFSHAGSSLHKVIAVVFAEQDIGDLASEVEHLPPEESEQRIEARLRRLHTLPTLPEIALRIMRMVADPQTTVEDLEEVLTSDPSIVHKLIQVVNSPVFAGAGHKDDWTLQEAIIRMGRKKVGAIAQQVKLMNSLIRPKKSQFDLQRFWRHSVGCALIADKLYREKLIPLQEEILFDDYWICAVLHDIGKLVLGFFFWDHFEEVLKKMEAANLPFRQAEKELGDLANHEFLGKVMLEKSQVGSKLVEAVEAHDTTGDAPTPLICLIHMADNIGTDLGLGYLPEERTAYSPAVLRVLDLDQEAVAKLVETCGQEVVKEVDDLVEQCLQE